MRNGIFNRSTIKKIGPLVAKKKMIKAIKDKNLTSHLFDVMSAKTAKNKGITPICGVPSPYIVDQKLRVAGFPKKSGANKVKVFLKGMVYIANTSFENASVRGELTYSSIIGIV